METLRLLEAFDVHLDRLKAAALKAGPDAAIPDCPKWTVKDLVSHLVMVHSFTVAGITGNPRGEDPEPSDWDDLLGLWDGRRMAAREALAGAPDTLVHAPLGGPQVPRSVWVRRMAHETAIHRLDAEGALGLKTTFSPPFAADGIDEYLTFITPHRRSKAESAGTASFRATDTGHEWTVRYAPGELPSASRSASEDAGVTVSGTADQLYRAVWGRPAEVGTAGEAALLRPLAAP